MDRRKRKETDYAILVRRGRDKLQRLGTVRAYAPEAARRRAFRELPDVVSGFPRTVTVIAVPTRSLAEETFTREGRRVQ